jgi:hypothetical protein
MRPNTLALAACTLLHGLAAVALLAASAADPAPAAAPAPALAVRLVAVPAGSARGAANPAPGPAASASDARPYFHFPHEVDRELIPLRDRSGDAGIELDRRVVMNLFVDANGRVADVSFEHRAPSMLMQARLRAAFASMEFLPAQKGGRGVAARIRIELLPNAPGDQQPSGA